MAAATYFITAQLSLVAISAYLVHSEAPKSSAPRIFSPTTPKFQPKPVNPEMLVPASILPPETSEYYASAQKSDTTDSFSKNDRPERPMGTTTDDNHLRLPFDFGGQPQPTSTRIAREDNPPEFDPVPENQGYHIDADALTNFDLKSQTMVFSGNVSLKCAAFTLNSRRLVAHMEANSSSLKKLVANGDVDVHVKGNTKENAYRGHGEEAVFDPATGKIALTGWPKIIGEGREHNAASASTIMTLDTKNPELHTTGRAKTRLRMDGKGGMPGISMGPPSVPATPRPQ